MRLAADDTCYMDRWHVDDLMKLSDAIIAAGLHSFVVRRALQRMEQGEITPLETAEIIRQSSNTATRLEP